MLKIICFWKNKNVVYNDILIHVYSTKTCRNAVDISFILSLINGQVGWSVTRSSEIIALINEKYKPRQKNNEVFMNLKLVWANDGTPA